MSPYFWNPPGSAAVISRPVLTEQPEPTSPAEASFRTVNFRSFWFSNRIVCLVFQYICLNFDSRSIISTYVFLLWFLTDSFFQWVLIEGFVDTHLGSFCFWRTCWRGHCPKNHDSQLMKSAVESINTKMKVESSGKVIIAVSQRNMMEHDGTWWNMMEQIGLVKWFWQRNVTNWLLRKLHCRNLPDWRWLRGSEASGQIWSLFFDWKVPFCWCNVGMAIINNKPSPVHHHFYGWYKPSNMGGLLLLYPH